MEVFSNITFDGWNLEKRKDTKILYVATHKKRKKDRVTWQISINVG